MEAKHDSVMTDEVLVALRVAPSDTVVDATLGGAGHFSHLLSVLGESGVLVGIDADSEGVERGRVAAAADVRANKPSVHLVNDNFRHLKDILASLQIDGIDAILFDLGWSGYQIASPRGFSFQSDEPLLMTYGEHTETAADIVNSASEADLADLIYTYGEERHSRGIARSIVEARSQERILTTAQLVAAIEAGVPASYRKGKSHFATKTFQALRIAVNDEIGSMRQGINSAIDSCRAGGRVAVITFHSIEDRVVKNLLRDAVLAGKGALTPKKAIVPSRAEILRNRRARSAKLRVFTYA